MKLMYLDQEAIDEIKMNFSQYKKHFSDKTNEWFIKHFSSKGWLKESKLVFDDLNMDYNDDYGISDEKNVQIVYEAFKELSPVHASDERIWAALLFGPLWDYVQYRRKEELESGNERDILNTFFFMRGTKRSCFMNCVSRLWWTGFLLYDKENKQNHYEMVNLICESAFASNIILLSSNNFASNKNVILGMLECINDRRLTGEKIGRYHYVEVNKYLNCLGGTILLDTLTRQEVKSIVKSILDKREVA